MAFTVRDLLEMPLLRRARPEVLVGSDLGAREVRWVHTSEIYGISPLLKGGEVLLTTGLGLVGAAGPGIGAYVESLAAQGVAALLLELGRTFPTPPDALVAAAREHDLPLVVLHGVVPFIEVTEAVHPLLITGELDVLRRADEVTAVLHDAVAEGIGGPELVALVAQCCRAPVGVYSPDGTLLLGEDVRSRVGPPLEAEVGRTPWATLAVADTREPALPRLVALCATMLDLRLGPGGGTGRRTGPGSDLVLALAAGQHLSRGDVLVRARAAGLAPGAGVQAVGLAVELRLPGSLRPGLSATVEAAQAAFGAALVAEVDGVLLVATTVRPSALRARLADFAEGLDAELRATVGGGVVRVAAGPPVEDPAGLARSLPAARDALHLAARLTPGSRTVLASDVGVYRLLSGMVDDAELGRFVEDQLGALLDHDARHGAELVPTLDAYLEAGLSKTVAAHALGIRRQTLYARLERITGLLGGLDLETRQVRTALDLALVGWRMRSSAVTRRSRA
ncbi:PucR family transcriptional regulator ligand-binding domain-containing protein [Nocardioides sp. Arc9.136]|uniref:PucR family transcriptional regulator n=1 Tax=Nocardioides sp. Arc9.136 TaxID=2996826 RepID=UPI0026659D94|nr:PucR family transcriptional regulator ligand-binding domain-containing protein [Nocardioides sp. Arc9.136]WKN48017.1 PucR family transcriptional regulator ligand-binding domain-containing protein [Nocardioides sp. Arc9.136]